MAGATKFYRPVLAKATGKEKAFMEKKFGMEIDAPEFDFLIPGGEPIKTRRVALGGNPKKVAPGSFEMGPFQITYNFSSAIRRNMFTTISGKPGRYGETGFSFRMLYEYICDRYNGGYYFVDTYFAQVFSSRPVRDELKDIYETIKDDIREEQLSIFMTLPLRKDGQPDMRYTASKKWKDFKVWQNPIIRRDCKRLAREIRRDVKSCLYRGMIPMSGRENAVVSKTTKERRAKFVDIVNADKLFFASGQLIDHLNIYVEVGDVAA